MNRLYIFSFILALSFAACNSSSSSQEANADEPTNEAANDEASNADNSDNVENSNEAYTTTVIDASAKSPKKEMTAKMGEETVKVTYSSPSMKGRTIWGELVPYDKVWRTGADDATIFEVSKKIKFQDKELEAGKYALFTIPKEDGSWTVILNSVYDQWGAYQYNQEKDVLRVEAQSEARDNTSETMDFIVKDNNLVFLWEKLAVPISIVM